jgi:hypothetical protein
MSQFLVVIEMFAIFWVMISLTTCFYDIFSGSMLLVNQVQSRMVVFVILHVAGSHCFGISFSDFFQRLNTANAA